MMQSHGLFLLLYLTGLCWGMSLGFRNASCSTGATCASMDPAEGFLQCVGLPSNDTGPQHLHRLHSVMEALMDLYTFMRASIHGVPVLSLAGELSLSLNGEPLQNEDLVHMWLEVKMKPLLHSMSKQLLSCLSSKNFSCNTYQLMVKELSVHFSHMDPMRQKWIYDFFMFPFLSRDDVRGCVEPGQNSVEWLLKNFGDFKAMARVKDFSTLHMEFSGLEVLHLLSPTQKADMLLTPGVAGLDNGTLYLVFKSLMEHSNTSKPGTGHNWTIAPPYDPSPTSIDHRVPTISKVWNGFMTAFGPISGLVHEFVTYTKEVDVATIRSTDLTQLVLNFTLSELADMYTSPAPPPSLDGPLYFDPTSVEDWYMQVVMPVLLRFLPKHLITQTNISMAFHDLFYLERGMNESAMELQDVCSLTMDQAQCGLTDVVEDLAHVLHCAAQTKLTLNEKNVLGLLYGLTHRLTSLLRVLTNADLQALAADVKEIFTGSTSAAVTQEHLTDPDFIQTWFQVKLLPLLPDVSPDLLSCLSRKNFSCSVYQTIVWNLSDHMMEASHEYQESIYENFIHAFLWHSGAQCVSNNSAEWIHLNFGLFSRFANIIDFYRLNPHFSGVEALPHLIPKQIAELLLLPSPPEKPEVVDEVFDYLLGAPDRHFKEVMEAVVELASKVNVSCARYTHIFVRLYGSIPSESPALEPHVWASIEDLISVAPQECVPENITCPAIQLNGTDLCGHMSGPDSWSFSNMSMNSLCSFSLEKYACAQLENFTANHLATLMSCDLPGNNSHSQMLWKLLLMKLSSILNPALDILAERPMQHVSSSAMEILDVLGEIRVSMLTDQELRNSSLVHSWFSRRLRPFLPYASGRFLRCLSHRNISCSSFQHILQIFSEGFKNMTLKQQHVILKYYIVRFLSHNISGPGCMSMNSSLWLSQNLGPFSQLLPLERVLELNSYFDPLSVLHLLTPEQCVELLILPLETDKVTIINKLFDLYTEGPKKAQLPEFLALLPRYVPQANLSCPAYRTLFNRLDLTMASVSLETKSSIIRTKKALIPHIPHGCDIYEGQCTVTVRNETQICTGVNSTSPQLLIDQGLMSGHFCNFSVEQLACASLSDLTGEDLAELLTCSRPVNSSGSRASWKLLLSKVPHALDSALDLLANRTLDPTQAALPLILDVIREIQLDNFPDDQINHPLVIHEWLSKLRPFLPSVSMDFLHCLTTKALNCSTFQHIVHVLSMQQPHMTRDTQMNIYTHFIKVFLTRNNTADPGCAAHSNGSMAWMAANLGAFSELVPFSDLHDLNPEFSAMAALPMLTMQQLVELCATPGQLTSSAEVTMVMLHVPNTEFTAFFDQYCAAINGRESLYAPSVIPAMLQVVFDRGNLSDPSTPEPVLWGWMLKMKPLLFRMSPTHVGPFFMIIDGRSCALQEQGVANLNATVMTEDTRQSITNHIVKSLKGLSCYGNNPNYSFFRFLDRHFMGFPYPNLYIILSLMPHNRMYQMLNSMSVPEMKILLSRPDVVDSDTVPCELYKNYDKTPEVMLAGISEHIKASTLGCVWPLALSESSPAKAAVWFEALPTCMDHMNKSFVSPSVTSNSTCVAFSELVRLMGNYDYTGKGFNREYMYDSIKTYLPSDSVPKCYNASDPHLNSTAYFAMYIGLFFRFMNLETLQLFGSEQYLQLFAVDQENIALLNHSALPQNLTDYYTELVYQQDSNFNPLLLPLLCRCVAPGPAFTQLLPDQTMIVLYNLSNTCIEVDPQIAAALAGNFGNNINSIIIDALGQECTGLSTGQIWSIKKKHVMAGMGTLSTVNQWNWANAYAFIQILLSDGNFQINSTTLLMIGTLAKGLPSSAFTRISSSELQMVSKDPTFLQNMMSAPTVTQQSFLWKLIATYSNSEAMVEGVPNEMAYLIPRVKLVSLSNKSSMLHKLNKMKWKRQQVELFFSIMAPETATAALNGTDVLSSSVLQGFTCTGVRNFQKKQIKKLVKACRRKGKNKVQLVESQLTCMYFYIENAADTTVFSLYPPDVLLYYNYSLVPTSSCREYFEQLADADFSVFSSERSSQKDLLFTHAKFCLGINSNSLTQDQVTVLGNMCCTLNAAYIRNSDPSILEKLKNCPELTDDQAIAAQTLLESGNTIYGNVSTWDQQTLINLERLPLYFKSPFYMHFNKKTKKDFYKHFRKNYKKIICRCKMKSMKKQIRMSNKGKTKRSTDCTVGEITQVTISDESFPMDYTDVAQFNSCLSAATVRDNLASITEKVDDEEFLRVVLDKLNEVYAGSSPIVIPENQVQLLGPASRVATLQDISYWTITQLDTLAALMNPEDGLWEPSLAKAVINKYLSIDGNSLGSAELNSIGGINLCSLDSQTLSSISVQSLQDADNLDVSNCSEENEEALFKIARQSFSSTTRSSASVPTYQLIQPYIGGADVSYVRSLVNSNINMDLPTFINLKESVAKALSVNEVQGLLGAHTQELKVYENNPVVRAWITERYQSDLDTLGIGLKGGRTTTTPAPGVNSTTGAVNTTGAANTTGATNTTGAANTTGATITTGAANTTGPANTTGATNTTASAGATTAATGATANPGASTTSTTSSTTNSTTSSASPTAKPSSASCGLPLLLLLVLSTYQHIFT